MRALLLICLAACGESEGVGTVDIAAIQPSSGPNTTTVPVQIEGVFRGDGALTVALGDTALVDVMLIDESTIEAVVPAGIGVGSYDVVVTLGSRSDVAVGAYIVLAP